MRTELLKLLLPLFLLPLACIGQTADDTTEAKPHSTSEYRLSPAAAAAGIDGKIQIGLTIDESGKASGLKIYGGPMWPCGTNPKSEANEVIKAVKEHILATKFSPEVKDGKPRSVSAQITFMLSDAFKAAAKIPGRVAVTSSTDSGLVDVGPINGRAASLLKPFSSTGARSGLIQVQVLVDENGKVTSAGSFRGTQPFISAAVDAACGSRFNPATVAGKPVKMTGILIYVFN